MQAEYLVSMQNGSAVIEPLAELVGDEGQDVLDRSEHEELDLGEIQNNESDVDDDDEDESKESDDGSDSDAGFLEDILDVGALGSKSDDGDGSGDDDGD